MLFFFEILGINTRAFPFEQNGKLLGAPGILPVFLFFLTFFGRTFYSRIEQGKTETVLKTGFLFLVKFEKRFLNGKSHKETQPTFLVSDGKIPCILLKSQDGTWNTFVFGARKELERTVEILLSRRNKTRNKTEG